MNTNDAVSHGPMYILQSQTHYIRLMSLGMTVTREIKNFKQRVHKVMEDAIFAYGNANQSNSNENSHDSSA